MEEDFKIGTLYNKHNYIADIDLIKNVPISEYDMKEAGYNLLKWKGYFREDEIEKLDKMSKQERSVEIGKLQRIDSDLSRLLMSCFVEARMMFFENNRLEDHEVLSIKKDAILTLRKCNNTQINEYIDFREKNSYIGYIKLMNREFYYDGRQSKFDVKGFSKDTVDHHSDFLFKDLLTIFTKMINGFDSYIDDLMYLKHDFCSYELPKGYYRDLILDAYVMKIYGEHLMKLDEIEESMKFKCFNNNNLNFILNMLNVLI